MNNNYPGFIFLVALLSGCATMSKEECKQADWYLKGVEDASQGYATDRVVEHGKACARVNVVPDMKEYRKGHLKGARLYWLYADRTNRYLETGGIITGSLIVVRLLNNSVVLRHLKP